MKKPFTLILLVSTLVAARLGYTQCLSGWNYRIPVEVYNNYGFDLHNYQVKVIVNTAALVSAGHMQADGDDIRFSMDCCNYLPHTIVSGMNTASTEIWVKIPYVGAWYTAAVFMHYGNPSASSVDNPGGVFDLWEPFDNSVNHFMSSCGVGTYNVAGGIASLSWSSNMMLESDIIFDMDTVYTAEMNVTAASGNWPGINFSKVSPDYKGYGMLLGGTSPRLGEAGTSASDFCRGENWASGIFSASSVVGLWSITWPYTGYAFGSFPTVGTITSSSVTHSRDNDLKVCIGGISGGVGAMSVDWIRVRKYVQFEPIVTVYTEEPVGYQYVSLPGDTILCDVNNFVIDAGSGFWNYTWSNATYDQTLSVNMPGTYYVTTMDSLYCYSTDTIVVGEHPPVSLSLPTGFSVCPGDSVLLDAGSGFSNYDWTPGGSTQTQLAMNAGTYTITVTDINGCNATDSVIVNHYPEPIANFMTFMPSDLTINFVNTSVGASTYEWDFGNGVTSNGPDTTFTYAAPGQYNVCLTVTNASGCVDDTCRVLDVGYIGIQNELDGISVNLFPNPATSHCWIQTSSVLNHAKVSMMDIAGKVVREYLFETLQQQELDITGMSAGTYLMRISTPGGVYTATLIVK